MYSKIGSGIQSVALINGQNGIYDNLIQNNSARYGRNAIQNHVDYLKSYHIPPIESNIQENDSFEVKMQKTDEFVKKLQDRQQQLPPINFQLNYMKIPSRGVVDKDALMAASYEELGNQFLVSVKQMNPIMANAMDTLDLNRDGYVDISEYSTSILLADMLDDDYQLPNGQNIDGVITNKGENRLVQYALPQNKDIAYRTYLSLYQGYNLGEASRNFVTNQNNTMKLN